MNWGFGAWDSDKCTTVMSEQHSTVCECYTDGTFGKYLPSSYSEVSNSGTCTPIYFWVEIAQKPAISCNSM